VSLFSLTYFPDIQSQTHQYGIQVEVKVEIEKGFKISCEIFHIHFLFSAHRQFLDFCLSDFYLFLNLNLS